MNWEQERERIATLKRWMLIDNVATLLGLALILAIAFC